MWYYFLFYLKCAGFEFTDFIHIDLFYHFHTYHLFTVQKKIGLLKLIYFLFIDEIIILSNKLIIVFTKLFDIN